MISRDSVIDLTVQPEWLVDPTDQYRSWRDAGPTLRAVTPDGAPVWLVTRYAEVKAALNDPRLSLNKVNAGGGYRGFDLPAALDANLLNLDPPDHLRLRRLVSAAFTARRVESLRPRIQQLTDELLDAVVGDGGLTSSRRSRCPYRSR